MAFPVFSSKKPERTEPKFFYFNHEKFAVDMDDVFEAKEGDRIVFKNQRGELFVGNVSKKDNGFYGVQLDNGNTQIVSQDNVFGVKKDD